MKKTFRARVGVAIATLSPNSTAAVNRRRRFGDTQW